MSVCASWIACECKQLSLLAMLCRAGRCPPGSACGQSHLAKPLAPLLNMHLTMSLMRKHGRPSLIMASMAPIQTHGCSSRVTPLLLWPIQVCTCQPMCLHTPVLDMQAIHFCTWMVKSCLIL